MPLCTQLLPAMMPVQRSRRRPFPPPLRATPHPARLTSAAPGRRPAGSRGRPDEDLKDEIEVKDAAAAGGADLAATVDAEDAKAAGGGVPAAEAVVQLGAEPIRVSAAICPRQSPLRTGPTSRPRKRLARPKNRICRRSCCPANLSRSTGHGPPRSLWARQHHPWNLQ